MTEAQPTTEQEIREKYEKKAGYLSRVERKAVISANALFLAGVLTASVGLVNELRVSGKYWVRNQYVAAVENQERANELEKSLGMAPKKVTDSVKNIAGYLGEQVRKIETSAEYLECSQFRETYVKKPCKLSLLGFIPALFASSLGIGMRRLGNRNFDRKCDELHNFRERNSVEPRYSICR